MIAKAKIGALVDYGIKYWEVQCFDENEKRLGIVEVSLKTAQDRGITKRLNGTKKMNEWLNSKEGLGYLNKKTGGSHEPIKPNHPNP